MIDVMYSVRWIGDWAWISRRIDVDLGELISGACRAVIRGGYVGT